MSKHEFSEGNQPKERKPRGKSERTKILEAMKRCEKTEDGFYDLLVERAHDKHDSFGFTELLKRISPIPKQTMPFIKIDYPDKGTLVEKANAVEIAIFNGTIPPDVGISLLGSLGSVAKTEEVTELSKRIESIEKAMGLDNG